MRFLLAHMNEDPVFLSPHSWAWLHRPVPGTDYVAGWGSDGPALFHSGSNTMWYATVAFNPAQERAIAIFANVATRKVVSAVEGAVRDFMMAP